MTVKPRTQPDEETVSGTDQEATIEPIVMDEEHDGETDQENTADQSDDSDHTAQANISLSTHENTVANTGTETGTETESENKKNRIGIVILIIISIILIFELAILGIRYLAPDSDAAFMINSTQTRLTDTISGWFRISDSDSGKDSSNDATIENQEKEDTTDTEQQTPDLSESTPEPDPAPMADKAALVATQLANNVNIQQVNANETLAYQEGRDYGRADINQSKPIANNIWQTPEGAAPVYYDQSIVGTIIAFDSQWIDYVNGSSKNVLSLLKEGSTAYKYAVSYPKIGKVQETFKLLEIGEIRQGDQGFYVWTHEVIQLTEKGQTSEKKYNWIYYLEPVDGKMNIVNYFKF